MKMTDAMKKCPQGCEVCRKAYPNIRYRKDGSGIFPEAVQVDYIDFIATDWIVCGLNGEAS